jgi:uncharacterized membrane protein
MFFCTIEDDRTRRILIRPDRSLTWRQTKFVYAGIAIYSLSIALGMTAMGYWPILPFAGLELLGLGAGFYVVALDGRRSELVRVSADKVAVEKTPSHGGGTWETDRAWAQVRLLRSRIGWHPSRLVIRSHGKEVALGGFLTEGERRALAGELRRALAHG